MYIATMYVNFASFPNVFVLKLNIWFEGDVFYYFIIKFCDIPWRQSTSSSVTCTELWWS